MENPMKKVLLSLSFIVISFAQVSNVDWETQVYPIFTDAGCLGCHGSSGGFTIGSTATEAYSNIVNEMSSCNSLDYVEPSDPSTSFLYLKLSGTPACGSRMPQNNQTYFDTNTDQLELINVWIQEGALPAAQPADGGVFFSEYIEGSSYNKAVEIFNATGAALDLSTYTIQLSRNGFGWGMYDATTVEPGFTYQMTGTLAAGDVLVLAADAAGADILAVTDVAFAYPSVCHYNGDDAVGLFENGTLIDAIGVELEDPGTSWSVAGVANATGEHTLVRKATVNGGNTNWAVSAGTDADNSEWIVYASDTFENLGFHVWSGGGGDNLAPVANAGQDQTVEYDIEVTLDGSSSLDPDGSIAGYLWAQISGTTVTLTNAATSIASFTSPSSDATLIFTLLVTDDEGATDTDTLTVNVMDISPAAVFFSEYIEGSSYNKAVEIFNGTDAAIDLAEFQFWQISGGGEWPEFTIDLTGTLATGETYVICHTQADPIMLAAADLVITLYHNGNDAQGLAQNFGGSWILIDAVGESGTDPGVGWDVAGVTDGTKDHTIVRKSTVLVGNTDWASSAGTNGTDSEWIVYDNNTFDYLGLHNQNANAPMVTNVSSTPDFVTSSTELELLADITPITGTISSASIWYGTDGSLLNESEMWLETGDTWAGVIPPQTGNSILQFKVSGTDDTGNTGESTTSSVMVANSTPNSIADIQADVASYLEQIVTIQGIVTIGVGVLDADDTKAYIQDGSGHGINIFDFDIMPNMDRGDELLMVGYVDQYFTTIEIVDFTYNRLSTGNELPAAAEVTVAQANSSEYEGSLITVSSTISNTTAITGGTKLTLAEGNDSTFVMIWGSTGINTTPLTVGSTWSFTGVGSQYSEDFQLLLGYSEDVVNLGINDDTNLPTMFGLHTAYPNPFNPSTTLAWTMDHSGEHELSVYNIIGQRVAVLSSGFMDAGSYTSTWQAGELSSGVYFVQLTSEHKKDIHKILLVK